MTETIVCCAVAKKPRLEDLWILQRYELIQNKIKHGSGRFLLDWKALILVSRLSCSSNQFEKPKHKF